MDKDILHIITAGTMAPSGDNCQPWRFETGPGFIDVYNVPERDSSLYNWGQRPSYIANGAVIENMVIAAAKLGYKLTPKILPRTDSPELVARAYLERHAASSHPLYASIFKRATNRRPYALTALTADQLERFRSLSSGSAKLTMATDEYRRRTLARQVALNERVLFEDKRMHSFFFSHINWTDIQDTQRKMGFSIKTFELPTPIRAGFAIFKHYPAIRVLNAVGLSAMVAKTNADIYASGAAIGAITIPDRSATNYVATGRLLQQVWLTTTSLGLHLQPLTGIPLLMNRIADGDGTLSPAHARLVAQAYGELCNTLAVSDKVIALLFRIGHADPPSARTPRQEPDIRPSKNA